MKADFTKSEMKKFKRMFDGYYSVKDIAAALGRSEVAIIQKYRQLGWSRQFRTVRLIHFHGREILKFGTDPDAIKAAMAKKRENDKLKQIKERSARQKKAIDELQTNLNKGALRNHAIRLAYSSGATLNQIGAVVGLSKQGVGWIVTPPRPK